jgi:hypothetical protein
MDVLASATRLPERRTWGKQKENTERARDGRSNEKAEYNYNYYSK